MNIGLDYDDTYTRDPATWDKMIELFQLAGHKVYIVTWRFGRDDAYGNEGDIVVHDLSEKADGIYFTGRQAKQKYMFSKGIRIDVWIDDNPSAILHTMQGFER
jgi:hypothetical protein